MFTAQGWAIVKEKKSGAFFYIGRNGKAKLEGRRFADARACYGPTLFVTDGQGQSFCLDTLGNLLKKLGRVKLHRFSEGVLEVSDAKQRVHLLDSYGNEITKGRYYDCSQFINGFAAVFESPRFDEYNGLFLEETIFDVGQFMTGPTFYYDHLLAFKEFGLGDKVIFKPSSDGQIVNRQGKSVWIRKYQSVSPVSPEGWSAVGNSGAAAVFDTSGRLVLPWAKSRRIRLSADRPNTYISIQEGWQCMLVEKNGRPLQGTIVNPETGKDFEFSRLKYLGGVYFAGSRSSFDSQLPAYVFDTSGHRLKPYFGNSPDGGSSYDYCIYQMQWLQPNPGRVILYVLSKNIDDRRRQGYAMVSLQSGAILWPKLVNQEINLNPDPGVNPFYISKYP